MKIKDMFVKKIDREIDGVIVVGKDEEEKLAVELDEYVVTNELQKLFADFFASYKKGIVGDTTKVGVWITGFFGSGKSHFLEILAYLLDNKELKGKRAINYIIDDKKIVDNMVIADMKLAADTPTDVILFDIAAKGENSGNQEKDPLVNVFLRVFNEMQGFSGSMPHLADLERKLTEEGRYEEFKQAFEEECGDSWEESRQDFDFIQDTVVDILTDMNFMSEAAARNWCEKAMEPYMLSITDFANRIKRYLDTKDKNHHVVFMVDEVGQYIGENSRLMLDLQTIVEELGKVCNGKAWVVVTSQQDVDSISKVIGNDFSKIQGRFDTRLALSSANADVVIKKRILDKKEVATESLGVLYEQKATVIKNLIVFNDGVEKKLYESETDFSQVYPFVPYQFNMLASVLTSIRTHSSSGKHVSEGERSMLAMFKESAMQVMEQETGSLVPFYRFYDALENLLDHSHRSVMIKALDNGFINPDKKKEVFAVNVLKTLFLVKYILEITTNIDNITSLMISSIYDDRLELKTKVEEALNVLIKQKLVQKNGELYVFLTDEEQEINREIDSQDVDVAEVINKVSEMIFEDIFTEKKYRYPAYNGRYAFGFNQIVDDRPYKANQNYGIGLRIITPMYNDSTDDTTLRLMSGQSNEVIVLLPNDRAFLDEIKMSMKIEKFLRLNTSAQLAKYESIKDAKRGEMRERNANAKLYLKEAITEATIYANGDIVRVNSKDVNSKINEGLGRVVQNTYHKLEYIDTPMGDNEIRKLIKATNQMLLQLEGGTESNANACAEVLGHIALNSGGHMPTSMKTLKDRFMKAPYGFVEDDIHWIVAYLFKRGNIEFKVNGEKVSLINKSEDDIINFIIKKAYVEKLLIEQRETIPEDQKKKVITVMKKVFGVNSASNEEDTIMKNFKHYSQSLMTEMGRLEIEYTRYNYPGKKIIAEGKRLMQYVMQMDSVSEFFKSIAKNQDDFYDFAENYEPVKLFFGGTQKEIFMRALDMLAIYEDSKTYIVNDKLETVVSEMSIIIKKDQPYGDIPKLAELKDDCINIYGEILEAEEKPVLDAIEQARQRVVEVLDTKEYASQKKQTYTALFTEIYNGAKACNNVSQLRSYEDKADTLKIRLLNEMNRMDADIARRKAEEERRRAEEEAAKKGMSVEDIDKVQTVEVPLKTTKNVAIKSVTRTSSWRIENEEDVDRYIASLRKYILQELKEDVIINIEF